jgi:hypothetical protein
MKRNLPNPHEYRHLARTLFIASGAPYAESTLLLGQTLPGASGGYVHREHPVGRWKDLPSIGIDGGKSWTAKGGNVGFRMSETDWVIDIDPRRFPDGDDVLARNWLSVTDVIQRLGRARESTHDC